MANGHTAYSKRMVGVTLSKRYRIEEHLGTGPFSSVFKAADLELQGAYVALKCFHPALVQTAEARQAVQAQVLLMRQLAHSNIVKTFDLEHTNDGQVFLIAEYCSGWNLAELLQDRSQQKLGIEAAIHILYSLAQALAYAHARGVLHLNLKPENIHISKDQTIKVSDFSLSQAFDQADGFTFTGEPLANPTFMAPEQFSLEPTGSYTDVYSWSALGYRLLTTSREHASQDSFLGLAQKHLRGELHTRITSLPIPSELCEILQQCSNIAPDARLESGIEIQNALDTVFDTNTTPQAVQQQLTPKKKRKALKAWRLHLSIIVFTLVTGAVTTLWQEAPRKYLLAKVYSLERALDVEFSAIKQLFGVNYSLNSPEEIFRALDSEDLFIVDAQLQAGILKSTRSTQGDPLLLYLAKYRPKLLHHASRYYQRFEETDTRGNTLLHVCIQKQYNDVALELIQRGANPYILNKEGLNPLHLALTTNNNDAVTRLVITGVSTIPRTASGKTPLMLALTHFSTKESLESKLTLLLDYGAPVRAYDNDGKSTLEYAQETNFPEIVATIKQHWQQQSVAE